MPAVKSMRPSLTAVVGAAVCTTAVVGVSSKLGGGSATTTVGPGGGSVGFVAVIVDPLFGGDAVLFGGDVPLFPGGVPEFGGGAAASSCFCSAAIFWSTSAR